MSRIPYWNIDYGFLIDLLFVPALLVCGYGFYRQWKRLRLDGLKLKDVVQSVRSYFQGAHLSALVVKGVINSRLYRKILAGGAHHTGFSMAVTTEFMEDFCEMADIEYVNIGKDTKIPDIKKFFKKIHSLLP